MRGQKLRSGLEIFGVILFSALPQLIIYQQGYYYNSSLPAYVKYPLNVFCFLGVSLLGYWYLRQHKSTIAYKLWIVFYVSSSIIISIFYLLKYLKNNFNPNVYLNVMALFDVAVSPLPFIVATIILYLNRSFKKMDLLRKRKN